jgi:predicted NAD/FAD-binding protein
MKIAIIGTGIAGLSAAHYLHPEHEITVFEQNGYAGGHANTVTVRDGEGEVALDTGFLVYNERTYPNFTRLLKELQVATQPSSMSFSMQCRRCRIEYCSHTVRGLFARSEQIFRPRFHRMLFEIWRFHRLASQWLAAPDRDEATVGDFLRRRGFSQELVRHYVTPMASAIWSATTADAEHLPLEFFLRFFDNHGLLSVSKQPQWRTISGGSRRYVEALTRRFADRLHLNRPVRAVWRLANGVHLSLADGSTLAFDRVVIAAHADQALRLLADASEAEVQALRALRYQRNEAVLHTDARSLPRNRNTWASWNYHMDDCEQLDAPLPMTYYLNSLQRLESSTPYCVTLNDQGHIAPQKILRRIPYEHPVYTQSSLRAQRLLEDLNGARRTYYCGAYLGYGFHEDGVVSGLAVVRSLEASREAA